MGGRKKYGNQEIRKKTKSSRKASPIKEEDPDFLEFLPRSF
jgi:hypothetical protein